MAKLVKEASFYRTMAAIAIPVALQNLIVQATSIADTIMLGNADSSGVLLSASSLANQPFFILSMVCFGLASGAAVLSSQYWGKGDLQAIYTIFAMILKAALAVSVLFAAAAIALPRQVMGLYTNDARIIAAGAEYLRILGFAYVFFGFSSTLLCALRAVEIVRISVAVNAASFLVNVLGNWVLIFGHLGFAPMGIRGAAIATLLARLMEFAVAVIYVFCFERRFRFRVSCLGRFHGLLARDLVRFGTPVLLNEVMWALAMSVQAAVLGHITYCQGDPVAANTIASIVFELSAVVVFGACSAGAVLIGKAVGAGEFDKARARALTLVVLGVGLGLLSMGVILLLRPVVLGLYDLPPDTLSLANALLAIVAVLLFFTSVSCLCMMAVLRGAGDTRFCLVAEMSSLWLIATPLALILSWLHAPVLLVYAGMKADEPIKAIVCLLRVRSGKWINRVTRDLDVPC